MDPFGAPLVRVWKPRPGVQLNVSVEARFGRYGFPRPRLGLVSAPASGAVRRSGAKASTRSRRAPGWRGGAGAHSRGRTATTATAAVGARCRRRGSDCTQNATERAITHRHSERWGPPAATGSKNDAREASRKERAAAAGRTRAPAGPPLRNGVARARRSAAAPPSGSQGLHDRSGAQSSGSTSVIASTARAGGCARPRLRRSKWCRVLAGALLPRCLARIVLAGGHSSPRATACVRSGPDRSRAGWSAITAIALLIGLGARCRTPPISVGSSGLFVDVVDPVDLFRVRLDGRQVEVDDDWLLTAAYHHARQRGIRPGVDLLVRRERGDIDEVARSGLGRELEPLAPPHPRPSADDVDDAFQCTVVMRTGLRIWFDRDRPRPELFGAGSSGGDRGGAVHARRLRRVHIELVGVDHTHPGQPPIGSGTLGGYRCLAV